MYLDIVRFQSIQEGHQDDIFLFLHIFLSQNQFDLQVNLVFPHKNTAPSRF